MSVADTPQMSIEAMNERIRRCAFNAWLGLEIVAAGAGEVEVRIPWRAEMGGSPDTGNAHGGVLAAIIDATSSYAVASGIGRIGATLDMRIDYHRGAKPGPLRALGRVLKAGKTIATADVDLFDAADTLVASGRVVFFVRPPAS